MRVGEKVRRVAALGPGEWRALADGVVAAAQVEVGLRTQSLGRLIAWAESRPARTSADDNVDARRLCSLATWPYRALGVAPSCLRRSLVLTALMRQRSLPAVLCVGVRKEGPAIRAHAWVECGATAFDRSDEPYERLQPSAAGRLNRSVRWNP